MFFVTRHIVHRDKTGNKQKEFRNWS